MDEEASDDDERVFWLDDDDDDDDDDDNDDDDNDGDDKKENKRPEEMEKKIDCSVDAQESTHQDRSVSSSSDGETTLQGTSSPGNNRATTGPSGQPPGNVNHPSLEIGCAESGPIQRQSTSVDPVDRSENIGSQSAEVVVEESQHGSGTLGGDVESGTLGEDVEPADDVSAPQKKCKITTVTTTETSTYHGQPQVQIPVDRTVERRCSNSVHQPGALSSHVQPSGENLIRSGGNVFYMKGNKDVHINDGSCDLLKPIHQQSKLRLERDLNTRVFVKTEKIKECEKTLKTWGVLLLTGGPGEGKTTAGLHLLKLMSDSDSRRPLILTDPQQWDHLPGTTVKDNRYVILIDDAFGMTNLVEDLRTRWEQKFPMMLPLIEAGSVCVIFAFRTNIYLQYEEQFRTYELFRRCRPVNLASNEISEEERLEMLECHLKLCSRKANISDDEKKKIVQCRTIVSFPLCCYLFTSNIRKHYDCNFFHRSLKYLGDVISSTKRNDPEGFLVLLLVMFYDNLLPKRVFDVFGQGTSDQETIAKLAQVCAVKPSLGSLLNSAKSLCQTFLIFDTETECFSFMHNSIQDSVFIEFCKDHLSKGLEMCSTRTLLEYVRTEQRSSQDIAVIVPKTQYDKLASRLIKEILSSNNSLVFTHQAFKDLTFLSYLFLFMNGDTRTAISECDSEIQTCGVHRYLTETTVTFLMNKCLNRPTIQHTFDRRYVQVLSIDSIPACFVLNGADRIAIHLLKHMIQDEELFSRHANMTLACSFYMNNRGFVDELIELGAEITFDCFKAVCVAPSIDENLVELAAGIVSEEHADYMWNLLTLSLENGHFECIKQLVLFMAKRGRCLQLEEFCRRLLIVCHNTKPSWISVSQEQTELIELLELLHSQGVNCAADCCVMLAAGCHELQILKYLVKCGGNIHSMTESGQSPLHLAALYGSPDMVGYLIQQEVERHARDNDGYTPLHRAAQSLTESYDKIVLLADENAELHLTTGESVLETVIRKGDIESVEYICRQIPKKERQVGQPLFVALSELAQALSNPDRDADNVLKEKWTHNRYHIVQLLIKAEFPLSYLNDSMVSDLSVLVERRNEGIFETIIGACDMFSFVQLLKVANHARSDSFHKLENLVQSRLNVKTDDVRIKTMLHFACEGGDTVLVKDLVERGAGVNVEDSQSKTPLHVACGHGDTAMVAFLIQSGAKVNVQDKFGETPLHDACKRGDTAMAECLIQAGAEVNVKDKYGMIPLQYGLESADTAVIECLVQRGSDVNVQYNQCKTALHYACEHGHTVLLENLIQRGAAMNIKNKNGKTPLHFACGRGDTAMVAFLVQAGADVNVKDKYGETPLHYACARGDTGMIEHLVEGGAEVNAQDWNARTPLQYACACGDSAIVECLVQKGSDLHVKDNQSKTALHHACKRGDPAMVECLIKGGADVNVEDEDGKVPLQYVLEYCETAVVECIVNIFVRKV